MKSRRFAVLLVLTVVLAGCGLASPITPTFPESAVPGSLSPPGAADACEPIDLITPTGSRLDLSGTWSGPIGVHYVRQVGSCVWWILLGTDREGTHPAIVFRGELASDFTITGEWMVVMRPTYIAEPLNGDVTFDIELGSDGETIRLVSHDPGIEQGGVGPYAGSTLTYEGPLPAVPL